MASEPLSGVFAPALTPFNRDLSIDKAAHLQFCRWLASKKVGLAIFGTNSEANSLSMGERLELLDNLVTAGIPGSSLMPGTGTCALPDTLALTHAAIDAGSAAVLMLPLFFYKNVSEDGLFASFAEVIERIGDQRLKICLYHIPKFAGVPFSLQIIARLVTRYPGSVVGLKDSSGDISYTLSITKEFPQLRVFCASESLLLETMRNGGAGCISACANVNPAAIVKLLEEWRQPQAEELQRVLNPVRGIFELRPMIAALKAAAAVHGKYAGFSTVRPPLIGLDADETNALMSALEKTGFTMTELSHQLGGRS